MHSNHKRFLYGHLQIDMYEKFRVFYDNYLKSHTEHGFWLVDNVNFVTPHYREIKLIIIVILFPFDDSYNESYLRFQLKDKDCQSRP